MKEQSYMIYLDNSATTKICKPALDAYVEASLEDWGNPSSRHGVGKNAHDHIEQVRDLVRESIHAKGGQVIFTSGGTEANNLAIMGRVLSKDRFLKGKKILTTNGEHASVSYPLEDLHQKGVQVVAIPTLHGELDLETLERELNEDVILVTMMLVNNESGARYPLETVSQMMKAKAPEAVLHVDATQAYMKMPLSCVSLGCDMLTISSHKIEGPKGVGALWISDRVIKEKALKPQNMGGGQEGGYRSGTENVPGILAFGAAISYRMGRLAEDIATLKDLRTYLISKLQSNSELQLNLPKVAAPHIVSITLPQIKSETMLHFLSAKGFCVSSGSACSSHHANLSPAMQAYGLTPCEVDCTIRVSLGIQNTREDLDAFVVALEEGVGQLVRVRGCK